MRRIKLLAINPEQGNAGQKTSRGGEVGLGWGGGAEGAGGGEGSGLARSFMEKKVFESTK